MADSLKQFMADFDDDDEPMDDDKFFNLLWENRGEFGSIVIENMIQYMSESDWIEELD